MVQSFCSLEAVSLKPLSSRVYLMILTSQPFYITRKDLMYKSISKLSQKQER